jgi:pimeloyl-ACP methyl ester carboxylesterase
MLGFHDLLQCIDEQQCFTTEGVIAYRATGGALAGLPIVLLHGIGSGSASWVCQLSMLGERYPVFAWDAPGYGSSDPVVKPQADVYAQRLAAWLDVMKISRCVLVGHSLGAIMASAFAGLWPERVQGLLLLSPAVGYGEEDASFSIAKREQRLNLLAEGGIAAMAEKRSHHLLSTAAGVEEKEWVHWNMARIPDAGYRKATYLLANAYLPTSIRTYAGRVSLAVGAADSITPPSKCIQLASELSTSERIVKCEVLAGLGHASYIENPDLLTLLIANFADQCADL